MCCYQKWTRVLLQGEEALAGAAGGGAVGGPGSGVGEVRIVAPLGAPRSPASSPTMTASLVPLTAAGPADAGTGGTAPGGLDNNVTSFESTTHFEERTTRWTDQLRLSSVEQRTKVLRRYSWHSAAPIQLAQCCADTVGTVLVPCSWHSAAPIQLEP